MRRSAALAVLAVLALVSGLADVAEAGPTRGGPRRAVLIGVNKHQGTTRSNVGSVGDVNDLKEAMVRAGWQADNIKTLTDSGATAADIRSALRWLADTSTDDSYSAVHYSGHVKQEGSTEYLWPHDNKHIRDTEFADYVRQIKGWTWVNISGCEAAGFDEGISGPRRLFTASSKSTQKSYEYPDAANSVFTMLMVDDGMLRGRADANNDRRVSIQEAFAFAAKGAPGVTQNESHGPQEPQMAGGDGSEWFLDPLPPAPPPPPPVRCILFLCFPA